MRNLKRALSPALASVMVLGLMVVGFGASYADVTSEENQEAIEVLQAVGVMVGDDNGNFNPDEEVTRNEMAVIMCNLLNYTASSYANTAPFTDVADWAEPYVAACWTNGITAGYDATTYGGSDTVTTAQAAGARWVSCQIREHTRAAARTMTISHISLCTLNLFFVLLYIVSVILPQIFDYKK